MFYSILIVVNIKVLISSFEYTFWLVFWIVLGLLGYYVFYILFSFAIESSTLWGAMGQTIAMS